MERLILENIQSEAMLNAGMPGRLLRRRLEPHQPAAKPPTKARAILSLADDHANGYH